MTTPAKALEGFTGDSCGQRFPSIFRLFANYNDVPVANPDWLPEDGLVKDWLSQIEGNPNTATYHTVFAGVGEEALAALLQSGVDMGNLCAAGVRQDPGRGGVLVKLLRGFETAQGTKGKLAGAYFWLGDTAVTAGLGLYDVETQQLHLLPRPEVLAAQFDYNDTPGAVITPRDVAV